MIEDRSGIKQVKEGVYSLCKEIGMVAETYYHAEKNGLKTILKYSILFINNGIDEIIQLLNSVNSEEVVGNKNGREYRIKDFPSLLKDKESLEKIRPIEMLEKWSQS